MINKKPTGLLRVHLNLFSDLGKAMGPLAQYVIVEHDDGLSEEGLILSGDMVDLIILKHKKDESK